MDAQGFLKADIGRGDATTELLVPGVDGSAYVTCEQDTVIAGVKAVSDLLESVGLDVSALASDGDRVKAGSRVLSVSGSLRTIITAERTALNITVEFEGGFVYEKAIFFQTGGYMATLTLVSSQSDFTDDMTGLFFGLDD